MGGIRSVWTAGQALNDTDLIAFANNASTESDRVLETLIASPNTQKHILPLVDESTSNGTNPRLLVYPGSPWTVGPALFVAGQQSTANVAMASPFFLTGSSGLPGPFSAPAPAANSSGVNRYDLLYATLAYATLTTSSRKFKDPVGNGGISTQTLPTTQAPAITLAIVSSTVSVADALSKMPHDVAPTTFFFPLAVATLANGYAGLPLTQSQITQVWPGGFLRTQSIRGRRVASIIGAGAAESPTTGALGKIQIPNDSTNPPTTGDRWGSDERWIAIFTHKSANTIILDSTIDWRNRTISAEAARPAVSGGNYPAPESVTVGGGNSFRMGLGYTGTDGSVATSGTAPSGGTFSLSADTSTGNLKLTFSGTPTAAGGDGYVMTIDTSDRFVF